jgi:hypothetical protein
LRVSEIPLGRAGWRALSLRDAAVARAQRRLLLDQRTGEIWQRICDQKGAMVAFQRVKRLDENGNLEKDEATKPQ